MKRLLALLVLACMLLSSAGFAAEAPGPAPAADGLPQPGDVVAGFRVADNFPADYLDADCVLFEHEKTGTLLIYSANDDTDRAFNIAFRTPAENDKGIPHIFEHSTLCGSEKYPDPSLLFSMIAQTYNTYLNALTYSGATMFPSASLSEEQLFTFADYYLSGVFHPLIMTDERAMMREAYRYELAAADSPLTLTGTVYSEMQGAMTLRQTAYYNLYKEMYPGSVSANVSGGLPSEIPTLTIEELRAFHDAYYHPSNCLMVLYGDVDCERFLRLIDEEYLS